MAERMPYTQAGRMMAVSTRLGQDSFLLEHLEVDEAVNELFEIRAAVKSQRDDLQAADIVGSTVDFSLQLKEGGTRWWNGFVTGLHEGPLTTHETRSYAITARPQLWLLGQKSDCRIFQDQTSKQIVETLTKEHGIVDIDLRIVGRPIPQHYSVQWNETDLGYMLRRCQEDGLFYWFEHKQGHHTLVVADHPWGYGEGADARVRYAQGSTDGDHITDWQRTFSFTPGKRAGRDWNFETMSAPAGTQPSFVSLPGNTAHELYEYPGRFADRDGAEQMIKNRVQATETGFETVQARSTVRSLGPGQKITPYDVAKPGNKFEEQVITAIRHIAEDPTYEAGSGSPSYDNTFTVIPAKTPATPHRAQPRPKVVGSQIAIVAGPAGEEIYTDQFGRVKVWFPWDRRAAKDGTDTCWIRVGQPWAGSTWGHQVIPRVGMEALLSYQDGDPDRPFVTALVPDPKNVVPYPLPDNKTKHVIRSNSYKSSGFNEMTFEDATGAENMFFHAQKDQTTQVENDVTKSVGANESISIGQNKALTVGQNMTQEIGGSVNITIGGTGAGAASLMGPLLGLVGTTSGLLGEGLSGAGAGAAGGGLGGLMSSAMGMLPQIAGAAIGMLSSAGQQAQSGVVGPTNTGADAGAALAQSGAALGAAAAGLFPLPGMLNVTVGTLRTDSIGIAHAEQVGMSRATNIGMTDSQNVGQTRTVTIGQQYTVTVGSRYDLSAKDAISSQTTKHVMVASDTILLAAPGGEIEINKDGIIIKGKKVEIKGLSILLSKADGGCTADTATMEE